MVRNNVRRTPAEMNMVLAQRQSSVILIKDNNGTTRTQKLSFGR